MPDDFKKIPKIWQKWFRDRKHQGNNLKRANLFNNVFIFIVIVQCVMMNNIIIWRNVRIKCLKKVKSQWCDEKNKLKKILLVFQCEWNEKQMCFFVPKWLSQQKLWRHLWTVPRNLGEKSYEKKYYIIFSSIFSIFDIHN